MFLNAGNIILFFGFQKSNGGNAFMNIYSMVLYWQNKYFVMEKEVRKAQKGITRLKKREKYLLYCINSNNEVYKNLCRTCMVKK